MCQHVTVHGAATCSHAHTHAAGSLLEWATAQATSSLKCQVQHGARGRGLVAVQDIQAGEMILSVPLQRVYSSNVRVRCNGSRCNLLPHGAHLMQ